MLGRNELIFHAISEDSYEVRRNGQPAHSLSEGERTAVTLVHFMESVRQHDSARFGKPIVIVDDPVSSLDQGVFIGISSALWSLVARRDNMIEQLILLTHNFELFRQWDVQWDRFPRGLRAKKTIATGIGFSAYEMKPVVKNGRRTATLAPWPRSEASRRKVRSAYHHAFISLAEAHMSFRVNDDLDARLEAQLLFPNVIRRVLESFLSFKLPGHVGDLAGMMAECEPLLKSGGYLGDPDALRHDLLRYSNAYSHGETPQTDHLVGPEEVDAAICALFIFMRHVDETHFLGMCTATANDPESLLSPA